MDLRDALHEFRKQATIKKFGRSTLKDLGPGAIMPNAILERIVDCSHSGKITGPESLGKETHWTGATEYGADVVALIKKHCPPPKPPAAVSVLQVLDGQGSNAEGGSTEGASTSKQRICGKCKGTDHIGM